MTFLIAAQERIFMTYYFVTTSIRGEAYDQYLDWLRDEHIADVLANPGFLRCELLTHKAGPLEASSREIKCVYVLENEEFLRSYLQERALALREKATSKFPGQFSANREIWWNSETFIGKKI